MNILVTGAAGFIGSHLCEKLISNNKVVGLDNFCDFYDPKIKENMSPYSWVTNNPIRYHPYCF